MTHLGLRRLIGAALVDRELYNGLMNGQRSTLVDEFDLTNEEQEVLASFEAGSARDLATVVHHWLKEQGTQVRTPVHNTFIQIA